MTALLGVLFLLLTADLVLFSNWNDFEVWKLIALCGICIHQWINLLMISVCENAMRKMGPVTDEPLATHSGKMCSVPAFLSFSASWLKCFERIFLHMRLCCCISDLQLAEHGWILWDKVNTSLSFLFWIFCPIDIKWMKSNNFKTTESI